MHILLLGGGGREHALAWKLAQSPLCERLTAAPGNAGIAQLADCAPLDIENPAEVVRAATRLGVDFVVIGPEAPLAAGVADALRAAGIACFGPDKAAARLEASKSFTKEICAACGAPTAPAIRFDRADAAKIHVMTSPPPIVVKADGLAAGKGVTVAETVGAATAAIDAAFALGPGAAVLIEEFMPGEEASLFVLTDGAEARALPGAQDHKRAYDGDQGPNTGGMGAYSPAPVLSPEVEARAMEEIVRPVLAEMRRRGTPYRGVLYAGLMIEAGAPRLVEFNARFGDPETQALMLRLESDLAPLLFACSGARTRRGPGLKDLPIAWSPQAALTVVVAAQGYPGAYAKGDRIGGLEAAATIPGVEIFHAGTALSGREVVSAGGRVLNVCARGADVAEARARAYAAIARLEWPGGFYRADIAARAVAK